MALLTHAYSNVRYHLEEELSVANYLCFDREFKQALIFFLKNTRISSHIQNSKNMKLNRVQHINKFRFQTLINATVF